MSDCCSANPEKREKSTSDKLCPRCQKKGASVGEKTLKSLVLPTRLDELGDWKGFYFCSTPECEVVYFKREDIFHLILKTDLRVTVGMKEKDPAQKWVCYCFEHSEGTILEEIHRKGSSSAVELITAEIKAGNCSCEIKNPRGKCCLGDVRRAVEKYTLGKS